MMDSMSTPASMAPMNTRAISSASPPSCWTPKQRRHGGQRDGDEHVSSQRSDPAFKRPLLPHSPPSLVWILGRPERQGDGHGEAVGCQPRAERLPAPHGVLRARTATPARSLTAPDHQNASSGQRSLVGAAGGSHSANSCVCVCVPRAAAGAGGRAEGVRLSV